MVGGGKFEGESRVRLRSRLQTVVFGRGVGPGATNEGGRKGLENRNGFSSGGGSSAAAVDSGGVSISLKGGSGSGGDGGVAEDWVDETVLRAAMAKAYDTFALLHGPLQAALDAPVTLSRGVSGKGEDDGSGGGQSVVLPGVEILRRLATAQKRLRVVRTTAGLVNTDIRSLCGGSRGPRGRGWWVLPPKGCPCCCFSHSSRHLVRKKRGCCIIFHLIAIMHDGAHRDLG